MNKYVYLLDSDALIKLTKSSLINTLTKNLKCIITKEVYSEAVIRGKERYYKDAFVIEEIVKNKQLDIKNLRISKEITGEISVLALAKKNKRHIIVTDDRKFISILEREVIKFLVPTDMIILLYQLKKIDKINASKALEKIKGIITRYDYEYSKGSLVGK